MMSLYLFFSPYHTPGEAESLLLAKTILPPTFVPTCILETCFPLFWMFLPSDCVFPSVYKHTYGLPLFCEILPQN